MAFSVFSCTFLSFALQYLYLIRLGGFHVFLSSSLAFRFFQSSNHSASGFCQHVGFQEHAECILNRSHLVLRPLDASSLTLEAQILNDLIQAGYGGQYLLDSFRRALGLPEIKRPPVPPQDLLFDDVAALPNRSLILRFMNQELRHYHCDYLFQRPAYRVLWDLDLFSKFENTGSELIWPGILTLTNTFLYENGTVVHKSPRGRYRPRS